MIKEEIETSGLSITPIGDIIFSPDLVQEFYQFENREWTETVCRYLCSRPVSLWLVEGHDVIARMLVIKHHIRKNMDAGNPQNLLHCSSDEESFHREYAVLTENYAIIS